MKSKIVGVALVATCAMVWRMGVTQEPGTIYRYEVIVDRVVDGDTIDVRPVRVDRVRLKKADAWESRKSRRDPPVTDEEVRKGKAATRAVQELLRGKRVWLETYGERGRSGS